MNSVLMQQQAMRESEWEMLKEQAKIVAESGSVPRRFMKKPNDVLSAALFGRELGFGLVTSLNIIEVVDGQPNLKNEMKLALVRMSGHFVTQIEATNKTCTLEGTRNNGETMRVKVSIDEFAHLANKENWKRYAQDMLFWRAFGRLSRRLFSDVLLGQSYVHDELEEIAEFNFKNEKPAKNKKFVGTIATPAAIEKKANKDKDEASGEATEIEHEAQEIEGLEADIVEIADELEIKRYKALLRGKKIAAQDFVSTTNVILDKNFKALEEMNAEDIAKAVEYLQNHN